MLALAAVTFPAPGATLTEHMDIACVQNDVPGLDCTYRLLSAGQLESAVAEYDGDVVAGEISGGYPETGDTTAILILVDTSDPGRQPVVDINVRHIGRLLERARTHHRFGLAGFDTNLYVLAPVGSSLDDIREAASSLRASGRTTELYRNVREAVRMVGDSAATRRVLLIFSDGLAEDYAYHHDDVIALARELGVVINSIGYPRSVAQSVALQTIRRLSDETGGAYVQANHVDFAIPATFFDNLLDALDSGGRLSFNLGKFAASGAAGPVDLSLAFQTNSQSFLVLAPVVFPGVPRADEAPLLAPAADITERADASRPDSPPLRPAAIVPERPMWPWFVVLLVLLVLTFAGVVMLVVRIRRNGIGGSREPRGKPLAYLIAKDAAATRHVIDKTPWRIGRGRNNDLTLSDHSVSRLHAEIRVNDEGALTLNDLSSLNGVFVNDNRIDVVELRESDIVDIGDVRLDFTLHDENYETEAATVLVRTHTPI